jgi:hypothetical protein
LVTARVAGIGASKGAVLRVGRLLETCRTSSMSTEFHMIHHLARAFSVRTQTATGRTEPFLQAEAAAGKARPPIRPRPLTPWATPQRPPIEREKQAPATEQTEPRQEARVRISSDPCDARRTVIAGRFAEVCAALERLVLEQEVRA